MMAASMASISSALPVLYFYAASASCRSDQASTAVAHVFATRVAAVKPVERRFKVCRLVI
jgi:hypothetical protein